MDAIFLIAKVCGALVQSQAWLSCSWAEKLRCSVSSLMGLAYKFLSHGTGLQVALGRVNGGTVPALSLLLLPSDKPEPMQL